MSLISKFKICIFSLLVYLCHKNDQFNPLTHLHARHRCPHDSRGVLRRNEGNILIMSKIFASVLHNIAYLYRLYNIFFGQNTNLKN